MKIHPPYLDYNYFRQPKDWQNSYYEDAIDASILAYANEEFISKIIVKNNFEGKVIDKTDFQAILLKQNDIWMVAFRGTRSLNNWITDFDVEKNKEGLHKGFIYATESLLPQIIPIIKDKQVILTGHSLGAAMSAIAGIRLKDICNIKEIVNFGQPRIGNQSAVDLLKGIKWTRFKNGKDLVVDVPLEILDFKNGGTEVNLPQIKIPFWNIFSFEKPFIIPVDLLDHIPTLYSQQIWSGNFKNFMKKD